MSLDTWVSLGALVLVALGLWRVISKNFDKLDAKIDAARKEAKADNEKLRKELTAEVGPLRASTSITASPASMGA